MALYLATRSGSAVSPEAEVLRKSASAVVASKERSVALFGARSVVIERIYEVAAECENDDWDGEEGQGVSSLVIENAVSFVRALPDSVSLPEVAPESDGSISLDWVAGQARMFSISVGATNRLAYAWIDGTDRGHGVARFEGDAVPARVLDGIRELMHERTAAFRVA